MKTRLRSALLAAVCLCLIQIQAAPAQAGFFSNISDSVSNWWEGDPQENAAEEVQEFAEELVDLLADRQYEAVLKQVMSDSQRDLFASDPTFKHEQLRLLHKQRDVLISDLKRISFETATVSRDATVVSIPSVMPGSEPQYLSFTKCDERWIMALTAMDPAMKAEPLAAVASTEK